MIARVSMKSLICMLVIMIHSQCRHYEVGRGVDPIGGLHPVRAPHPGHARVSDLIIN